jgi:acyl-coenzyme A synthetase/AMP-(fatty) acid ligase
MATIQFVQGSEQPAIMPQSKQLLVTIADGMAIAKPQATFAEFPKSPTDFSKGNLRITYQNLANVVNGLAWWLTAQLGRSKDFETLTYVGPNDVRQNALILACMKTGHKLLLASTRLPPKALKELFQTTQCKAILTTDTSSPLSKSLAEAYALPTFQVPSVSVLLSERFPHYAYTKSFEAAKDDPVIVLHTSGTTSTPKPITYTNDWISSFVRATHLMPPEGTESKDVFFRGVRFFVMLAPFHAANIFSTLFCALTSETTIIYPPALAPPTVDVFIEGLKANHVEVAFIYPHFISQLAMNPAYLEVVSQRCETIMSGGGQIPQPHGDIVSNHCRFFTKYAATEFGAIACTYPSGSWNKENWRYITPHPAAGLRFQPHSEDKDGAQIMEAVITRTQNWENDQPIFKLFPNIQEYRTRDLFKPHPTLPDTYTCMGRLDDIIVLASGFKINPQTMEEGLTKHPAVKGAVMLGTGQARPSLLIETAEPPKKINGSGVNQIPQEVWEAIEKLNEDYFEHHRVLKRHVIVANEERPMPRAMKGTIQRKAAEGLYERELKELYAGT